jgi:predicted TIM-barrel fold metal-dependent hydrolase
VKVIDPHVHVLDKGHWPVEWWQWVAKDWASKEAGRRPEEVIERAEQNLMDPDGSRLIGQMDAVGIDIAVILPIDWGPDYHAGKSVDEINAHALDVVRRYPDRLIPFAGIDPRREHSAERLDRWLRGAYRGLKLYPSCGFFPNIPSAMALYEVCDARGAPVLFHTGDPLPLLTLEQSRPRHLFEVAKAFPELKILLAHCGIGKIDEWKDALEVAGQSKAACLELSVLLWDDSTEKEEIAVVRKIDEARNRLGIERIVFATDHVSGRRIRPPGFLDKVVGMFKRLPDTARRAGIKLTPYEHDLIMGGNAARLLGIPAEKAG